jgi:hypothetical protein
VNTEVTVNSLPATPSNLTATPATIFITFLWLFIKSPPVTFLVPYALL